YERSRGVGSTPVTLEEDMASHDGARPPRLIALTLVGSLGLAACAGAGGGGGGDAGGGGGGTVTIATVANPQMQDMQKLAPEFEKANPGIKLKFVILPENELRQKVT